ncbi:MAG: hypothetical protein JSU72_10880 [Deltaproteobacteria bacterium]|nr:MAG: hypothetical protein JSU72_10880 [Deltaproteobacteria bacterium]
MRFRFYKIGVFLEGLTSFKSLVISLMYLDKRFLADIFFGVTYFRVHTIPLQSSTGNREKAWFCYYDQDAGYLRNHHGIERVR